MTGVAQVGELSARTWENRFSSECRTGFSQLLHAACNCVPSRNWKPVYQSNCNGLQLDEVMHFSRLTSCHRVLGTLFRFLRRQTDWATYGNLEARKEIAKQWIILKVRYSYRFTTTTLSGYTSKITCVSRGIRFHP